MIETIPGSYYEKVLFKLNLKSFSFMSLVYLEEVKKKCVLNEMFLKLK